MCLHQDPQWFKAKFFLRAMVQAKVLAREDETQLGIASLRRANQLLDKFWDQ